MNSVQIEYFLSLCKYKNYSETARRHFVSQPTISKQIAALEEELGVKLFERSTNSLMLTMQGAIMKKAFSDAVRTVNDAQTKALNYSKSIADTINIGLLEGSDIGFFLIDPLTEVIDSFKQSMDIKIAFLSHKALNMRLHENALDIGITLINEVNAHTDLEYTKLRTISMGIISHRSLKIVKDGNLDLALVQKLPFFFTRDGSLGIKDFLKKQEKSLGLDSTQYKCVPNIDTMLINVELGLGIAIVINTPRIAQNDEIEFYPLEHQSTTIVAAWNRKNENHSKNLIVKRMRRYIIEKGQF